jgi:hypothetical protein
MSTGRIPRVITAFIIYIVLVDDYLHSTLAGDTDPRGITLGMTAGELLALKDFVKKLMGCDLSLTAGTVRPRSLSGPYDGSTKEIYTKAIFQKKFPDSEIGNLLQFFLRWINTKHPELKGPWSQVNGIVIS